MSTPPPTSPEERRRAPHTERLRPRASYNSWILLTVTVTLVIFLGLITWYGRFPSPFALEEPTDHELVHWLSREWRDRWPQIPGPPEAEIDEARARLLAGDTAAAIAALTRALSLDPDAPEPLLLLAVASLQAPEGTEGRLSPGQVIDLIAIIVQTDPETPLLPMAQAWERLQAGDAAGALAALPAGPDTTPAVALLRLQLVRALGEDPLPAAEALLAMAPGSADACAVVARRQLDQRLLVEVLETLAACPAGAELDRLRADALDGVGAFREAYAAYREAGAEVHAAAIAVQEGWLTPADEAVLAAQTPEAALHRLWWGLLTEDAARVASALSALEAAAVDGLQFDVARAAGLLALQRPQEALALVEGSEAPEAQTLAARALHALGDEEGARKAATAALIQQGRRVRLRLMTAALGVRIEPLGISELEHALYVGERQREMPWAALIPRAALAGLDAALVEAELRELSPEAALSVLDAAAQTEEGAERLEAERSAAGVQAWRRARSMPR